MTNGQVKGTSENNYDYTDEAPFNWEYGVHNTWWKLNEQYLSNILQLVHLLVYNPTKVPGILTTHIFQMTRKSHLSNGRHVCAIIYYAIATQTGPYFETLNKYHQTIGGYEDKSLDYNNYEKKLATKLFEVFGASQPFISEVVLGRPQKSSQGRDNFNQASKVTFQKSMMLYYLGMSGKPSWDGRLFKIGRPMLKARKKTRRESRVAGSGLPPPPPPPHSPSRGNVSIENISRVHNPPIRSEAQAQQEVASALTRMHQGSNYGSHFSATNNSLFPRSENQSHLFPSMSQHGDTRSHNQIDADNMHQYFHHEDEMKSSFSNQAGNNINQGHGNI